MESEPKWMSTISNRGMKKRPAAALEDDGAMVDEVRRKTMIREPRSRTIVHHALGPYGIYIYICMYVRMYVCIDDQFKDLLRSLS